MSTCCVQGCDNTLSSDPANVINDNHNGQMTPSISFHRFPRKRSLKQKWLHAIGRPDWNPPSTAHVCSQHFSSKQMKYNSENLHELKETGYPDRVLSISSCTSVKATQLIACRFCLATNVKMFSLQSGVLKTCLDTIVGLHENHNVDGLPQYLCYVCAAYLLKMYNVIEKSMIAQATLLEIYAENLEITKGLIFEQNRKKLNLVHTLQSHNTTPCTVFDYVYDENLNASVLVSVKHDIEDHDKLTKESSSGDIGDSETELKHQRLNELWRKLKRDIDESEDLLTDLYDKSFAVDPDILKTHRKVYKSKVTKLRDKQYNDTKIKTRGTSEKPNDHQNMKFKSGDSCDKIQIKNRSCSNIVDHDYSQAYVDGNKFKVTADNVVTGPYNAVPKNKNKKTVRFTQCDVDKTAMSRNYDPNEKLLIDHWYYTVKLTLKEQRQVWARNKRPLNPLESSRCDVCSKWVRRGKDYLRHIARHDPKSGNYKCAVCQVRFAKKHLLRKHVLMTHAKKYLCKLCPLVMYTKTAACHHRLKHKRSQNECSDCLCSFDTNYELQSHIASVHPPTPLQEQHQSERLQKVQATVSPEDSESLLEKVLPKEVAYECPICDSVFKTTAMLNQHILNIHQQLQFTKSAELPKQTEYLELDEAFSEDDDMEVSNTVDIENVRMKNKSILRNILGKEDSETDTCSESIGTFDDEHYAEYA